MKLIHTAFEPIGTGPWPAIIAFHGRGASAFDLLPLGSYICEGRFLLLCPQGQVEIPLGPSRGFAWFGGTPGNPLQPQQIETTVQTARDFLDEAVARYPLDPRKLVLLGFSQGGVMAYNLAVHYPRRFAAVVGLSTRFPAELKERAADLEGLSRLPVLIQHGRRDEVIAPERGRESAETLRACGAPVVFEEYDCGHEITAQALQAVSRFLTERVLDRV